MFLILGGGISGIAAIKYLKDVCFWDDYKKIEGVPIFESWENIEGMVVSPGISLNHRLIQEGMRRGIPFTNDIGLFLGQKRDGIKIGITGTNGKSTLCSMLHHVYPKQSRIGGNFGVSPLDLETIEKDGAYIIEISSYQLEILDPADLKKLDIGIITNISPHHIERHGSFQDYFNAKCRILSAKNQIIAAEKTFATWENTEIMAKMPTKFPNSNLFEKEEYRINWGMIERIFEVLDLNLEEAYTKMETYQPLEHRQEIVIEKPILVINDSKSCNPRSTKQAIKNIDLPIALIGGGFGNADWSCMEKDDWKKIKKVFVIGMNTDDITQILKRENVDYEIAQTLEIATLKAINFSLDNKCIVLLSPGYQSLDQFKNFEDRGENFKHIVKEIMK